MDKLAKLAEQRDSFLAKPLVRYAAAHSLTDAALAGALGCPPEKLSALKLCKLPRREHRTADIRRIAGYVGCDAEVLARVLTEVENLPPAADQ